MIKWPKYIYKNYSHFMNYSKPINQKLCKENKTWINLQILPNNKCSTFIRYAFSFYKTIAIKDDQML